MVETPRSVPTGTLSALSTEMTTIGIHWRRCLSQRPTRKLIRAAPKTRRTARPMNAEGKQPASPLSIPEPMCIPGPAAKPMRPIDAINNITSPISAISPA
jgi:hypothetical protein